MGLTPMAAHRFHAAFLFVLALASGSATVWIGPESAISLLPGTVAVALALVLDRRLPGRPLQVEGPNDSPA